MTDYYLELTGIDWDSDGTEEIIEYHFPIAPEINETVQNNNTSVAGNDYLNTQVLPFGGQEKTINIIFFLRDDGSDRSNGTFGSSGISDSRISDGTVETMEEQRVYLDRYINTGIIGKQLYLRGGRFEDPDGDGTVEGTPVRIQRLPIPDIAEEVTAKRVNLQLRVGQEV